MPIIAPTAFRPPIWQINGHAQTIVPSLFRKIEGVVYERERLELEDGDFLDLDWNVNGSDRIVVVSHGLEGNSHRHYVQGAVKLFHQSGWDAVAWNCRSCSGEMNRLPRFYHHADTPDLAVVINHILEKTTYRKIALVGFSMGGSLTIHYLGEQGEQVDERIVVGVAISVPCDLEVCSQELEKPSKRFYNQRFLKRLRQKVTQKAALMPDLVSVEAFDRHNIRSCRIFDEHYTAPMHGFSSAEDFYDRASAKHRLSTIHRPLLILNALNDPFLAGDCYPTSLAENHDFVYLEMPKQGGHVGFVIAGSEFTYAELRALEFVIEKGQENEKD